MYFVYRSAMPGPSVIPANRSKLKMRQRISSETRPLFGGTRGSKSYPLLAYSLIHSVTQSLSHSVTQSLSHLLTHLLTHSLTHSLTQSLSHSVTHSLTHKI